MRASDVARLDGLIADDLVFVDQAGAVHGLALHGSGRLVLGRIDLSEQRVPALADGGGCVSLRATVAGRQAGESCAGAFRYRRVLALKDGALRVRAAQCSPIDS